MCGSLLRRVTSPTLSSAVNIYRKSYKHWYFNTLAMKPNWLILADALVNILVHKCQPNLSVSEQCCQSLPLWVYHFYITTLGTEGGILAELLFEDCAYLKLLGLELSSACFLCQGFDIVADGNQSFDMCIEDNGSNQASSGAHSHTDVHNVVSEMDINKRSQLVPANL